MTDTPSNYNLAAVAYREMCDLNDIPFEQPSEEYSQQINNVVYLRVGATGFLGRYDGQRGQVLV